jgi:hypothetical protein
MRKLLILLLVCPVLVAWFAISRKSPTLPPFRTVATPLASMPAGTDLSRPEGTYAALLRAFADGTADVRPLFHPKVHGKLRKSALQPRPEPERSEIRGARIEEVLEVGDFAAVIGTIGPLQKEGADLWFMQRNAGRWGALGNDRFTSIEKARDKARSSLARMAPLARVAAPVPAANPEAHLARFTSFLASSGRDPRAFLLDALASHDLVGFGEIHNRVTSWALLEALVEDASFAERTGTIYMELPRHAQPLMTRFLASPTLDVEPVREILRSVFQSGWPCKDEVDFLATVWGVNRGLPPSKRVRVVLVDQAWDWSRVKTRQDLATLESDRDAAMADAILADLAARPDPRHALFQVGYLHLPSALVRSGERAPYPSAGQRLRAVLGARLFTVVQHGPVMGNQGGQLDGRVRRGLFDEAFARAGNMPVAFALAGSPFGAEPFDMAMDLRGFDGTLGSTFDAYVFLGPLEQDRYSDVAPAFYTDRFAREVDRRYRLTSAVGVKEAEDLQGSDGAAIEAGMARWMGKPAAWVGHVGPVDAWRR